MKFISSKQTQKCKGRKQGKYIIKLEVTDYDLNMLEELVITYAPWKYRDVFTDKYGKDKKALVDISILDFNEKYRRWLKGVYRCFWKTFKKEGDVR